MRVTAAPAELRSWRAASAAPEPEPTHSLRAARQGRPLSPLPPPRPSDPVQWALLWLPGGWARPLRGDAGAVLGHRKTSPGGMSSGRSGSVTALVTGLRLAGGGGSDRTASALANAAEHNAPAGLKEQQ